MHCALLTEIIMMKGPDRPTEIPKQKLLNWAEKLSIKETCSVSKDVKVNLK